MKKLFALVALMMWQLLALAPASAQSDAGAGSTNRSRPVRTARPGVSPSKVTKVRSASHVEHIVEGDVIMDGEYIVEDLHGGGCDSCGGGGCSSCEVVGGMCNSCNAPHRFCICFPAHGWVSAEYLSWYQDGMRLPALATTSSGTTRATAGVLGQSATSVLYGNDEIFDTDTSGFRIRFGWWLSSFPGWGLEGEYAGLEEQTESFFQQSNGTPIIARPFFNALTGANDAELVAFPSVIRGSLSVDSTNQFVGGGFRLRRQLCCSSGCGFSPIFCQDVPTSSRLDGTIGYRYWELKESLQTREQLTSLLTNEPGTFDIMDRFETRNQFNGAEIGFLWQGRRGWWSLDALMRLGIGNVHQTVTVSGSSVINDGTTSTTYPTGFLAQSSNIGTYDRDQFTMVPELGLTLGYQMTKRLRVTAGYSLIYWGNVVRPGDQVDLDLNPNLLAPTNTPFTGPLRPQFAFTETDYWVQGLSFGGEFRW